MKTVIVTQDEPFYIPVFLGKVLTEYKSIIAVVILPGIPKGFTTVSYFKRLYDVFGPRDFFAYGALFIYYKTLDFLSCYKRFKRFYSVENAAKRNSIPVYKLQDINIRESLKLLSVLEPEIIVSVASPQIFKGELLNLAKYTVNMHAALLPQYRGMMPSFWVLAKGEERTGVTAHYVDDNIDTGNIIIQKTIDISPQDTLHSLQNKVAQDGALVLLEALERIRIGNDIGITPQEGGSYYSFPTKEAAKEFRGRGRRLI